MPFGHGMYFTSSETDGELFINKLAVMELRAQPWIATCTNEEPWRRALESISHSAVWRKELVQNLSDTCKVSKRAARDALIKSLGVPSFLIAMVGNNEGRS